MKRFLVLLAFVLAACSPTPGPRPFQADGGPLPSASDTCSHL